MCDAASDRDVRDLGCKKFKLNSPGRYTNAIRIYLSKRFYRFYFSHQEKEQRRLEANQYKLEGNNLYKEGKTNGKAC